MQSTVDSYSSISKLEESRSIEHITDVVLSTSYRLADKRADKRIYHAELIDETSAALASPDERKILWITEAISRLVNSGDLYPVANAGIPCYTLFMPVRAEVYASDRDNKLIRQQSVDAIRELNGRSEDPHSPLLLPTKKKNKKREEKVSCRAKPVFLTSQFQTEALGSK